MKLRLIDDWKQSYKKYSVIASAAIVGTAGADQIIPELLGVWEPLIPADVYPYFVAVAGTLAIIGRVIKQ
jgi:hypothetical protein